MNILYVAPLPIDLKVLGGVPKKIICQAKALSVKNNVDIIFYNEGRVLLYNVFQKDFFVIAKGRSKIDVIRNLSTVVKQKNYQGIYIRYPNSDMFFIQSLKYLSKSNPTIVVEIPTYPYDKEGMETLRGKVISFLDRRYRNKMAKYIDRVVTFSKDDYIFGIPTIRTINGINFSDIEYDTTVVDNERRIDLIAVSAMFKVHGYDRLIEGLKEYYSKGGRRNIVLKLIGKGDECSRYEKLTKEYGLQQHVLLLGPQYGDDLDKSYEGVSLGVNSLAIHRQGLEEESTLKTKEYAAKGLPVLSSSYVDAFSIEGNNKYVFRIPPDETSVNVEQLIRFIDDIYADPVNVVREDIRKDGMKTCDISITMDPILKFFEKGAVKC